MPYACSLLSYSQGTRSVAIYGGHPQISVKPVMLAPIQGRDFRDPFDSGVYGGKFASDIVEHGHLQQPRSWFSSIGR